MVDAVSVWVIHLRQSPQQVAALARLLDQTERDRADRMPPARRDLFVVAHGAARQVLGQVLGRPPAALRWTRGPHGKPELGGAEHWLRCNLSHSGDLAALATLPGRAVGIDLQERRSLPACRLATRFFPAEEAAHVAAAGGPMAQAERFTRLWARKEACLKCMGDRLLPGLSMPVLGFGAGGGHPRDIEVSHPNRGERMLVRDLPVADGFHAAVAVAGTASFEVTQQSWEPPR